MTIPAELHRIAELIATLEAERDRLIRDLAAAQIQRDIYITESRLP